MNETQATSTAASTEPGCDPVVPCKRIRTKMYYVLGRKAVDLTVSSPTCNSSMLRPHSPFKTE